ncbi:MAG: OmpA family protein [Pseudomonadota bacterium]
MFRFSFRGDTGITRNSLLPPALWRTAAPIIAPNVGPINETEHTMIRSPSLTAVAGIALAAATLTACQGISNRTLTTTGAGAVAGAGVGVLAGGDDRRNAVIGAAVGAIAGAAVGGYMDKQERELREKTAGTGIGVERQGDQIALTMPSNVTFGVDSADIQPGFYSTLNDVSNTLVDYPSTAVDIVGHASSDGDDAYNQRLSERRADAVQDYLVSQGMQPVRVATYGMGESQPIADNATAQGRAANRRVEILLTPIVDETA